MRADILRALIASHVDGNESAFRSYAAMAVAGIKSEAQRDACKEALEKRASKFVSVQQPNNGHLESLHATDLDTLTLPKSTMAELLSVLRELKHRDAISASGLRCRDRILLSGPSGEGKTMAAMWLASQLGLDAYGCNLASIVEGFLGKTGSNLDAVLRQCPRNCILVLDEIDAVASVRTKVDQAADGERNLTVNTLLSTLDRAFTPIIVATTNRPEILDPAIVRRLGRPILFESSTVERQLLADGLCAKYEIDRFSAEGCACFAEVAHKAERAAVEKIIKREEG